LSVPVARVELTLPSLPFSQLAIINGGFIRGNRVYEQGYSFTLGDVEREFPFPRKPFFIETLGTHSSVLSAVLVGTRVVAERLRRRIRQGDLGGARDRRSCCGGTGWLLPSSLQGYQPLIIRTQAFRSYCRTTMCTRRLDLQF
jgi:hypothetical protein